MCRYNGESDIHYSVIAKCGQDSVFFTWQLEAITRILPRGFHQLHQIKRDLDLLRG
jgi:hypothetical protein